jgi:hypothetical protein
MQTSYQKLQDHVNFVSLAILTCSSTSLERGWELMGLLCSTFPPSNYLLKYLAAFILDHIIESRSPLKDLADYCMKRLQKTVHIGQRNLVPSIGELSYIKVSLP